MGIKLRISIPVLVMLLVAAIAIGLIVVRSSERQISIEVAKRARVLVQEGMLRSDAVKVLGNETWQHCASPAPVMPNGQPEANFVAEDRFYYGSRDLSMAANITVQSTEQNGELRVNRIWEDDTDRIRVYYDIFCIKETATPNR